MTASTLPIVVITFYQFVPLPDCTTLRDELEQFCRDHALQGSIVLAEEGINATIAGSRSGIDSLIKRLRSDARLATLDIKESYTDQMPLNRLRIRVKPEIITLRQPDADPMEQVGTYVSPEDWNALITDPDVSLLDVRNEYEVEIGTFKQAINPQLSSFGQFPDYVEHHLDPQVHRKVAMFCTGGIRCEKASAYLLAQGFDQVYHLQGGILKYLEQVSPEQSLWDGECFVFDERVSLNHDLQPGHGKEYYGTATEVGYHNPQD